MKLLWNEVQSLEALPLTLLESAFPFCSLSTFISFSKHGDNTCPFLPPGPRPGWPAHPFLSIHRFISFTKPAPPPSFLPVALLKASGTQSCPQTTCLGCSLVKRRQVSGLRPHLHLQRSASALWCLSTINQEFGTNTATDFLRWAGEFQAVPQHHLLQDVLPHP